MNTPRTLGLFGLLIGALVAATAYLVLSGDPPAPGMPGAPKAGEPAAYEVAAAGAAAVDHERDELDAEDGVGEGLETLPPARRTTLAVTGRVTDALGNPIGGADVRVLNRQDFTALFRAGGGPGGQAGNFRNMGRRGGNMRQTMRDRFRQQPVADSVQTSPAGTFALRGEAFAEANLTVTVYHADYAPEIARRTWNEKEGDVALQDIVLENGARVTGAVVDENDQPVAGAEVRYERSQEDPGFGGGRGGRGGRGGFGRGNDIAELIPPVITDSMGAFVLGPVPSEAFELQANADGHLEGRSRRLQPEEGQPLPEQKIVAHTAARLTGVVHDPAGQPIADARVEVEVSRDAMMTRMRAERDMQRAAAEATGGQQPPGRRGGNRGNRDRGNRDSMRSMMDARDRTRTNDNGEFTLDRVPPAEIRLNVEHEDYLTTVQEPIDASHTAFVDVTMPPALVVAGQVVDARTGEPITNYGIRARRTDAQGRGGMFGGGGQMGGRGGRGDQGGRGGQMGGRGGRGDQGGRGGRGDQGGRGNRGGQEPAQNTPDPAEVARQAWLQERLGPSGRIAGRTPQPSAHPGGAFLLDGLQPGEYVLDIDAPDFVRLAAGPVTVDEKTGSLSDVTVRVDRGVSLHGRVVRRDGTPVADARVELTLPDPPGTTPDANRDQGNPFGGFGRGGGRGGRGRGRGTQLARANTDANGEFALDPQRPGTFRLRVTAEDVMDFEEDNLMLPADDARYEIRVTMTAGATVTGVVHNREEGSRVQVQLVQADDRSRHMASVDSDTGEYSINGLPPGGYFATLVQRGGSANRNSMLANAIALGERIDPDLFVAEGSTVRHDLTVGNDALGALNGSVWLNAQPATGMEVRLNRVNTDPAAQQPQQQRRGGNNPGGRMADMIQQLLRSNVAADGTFEIPAIPPGSYQLEVRRTRGGGGRGGRGGRGGSSVMHREPLEVPPYSEGTVRVDMLTTQVEFQITANNGEAPGRLRVAIALVDEVGDQEPRQWRRLSSYRSLFVRDGTTGPQEVTPGLYRYSISGRNLKTVTGDVMVAAGVPVVMPVMVEVVEAPEGASPGGQGGGQRGGGQGGGQRGGGQGGGQRGGGNGGR